MSGKLQDFLNNFSADQRSKKLDPRKFFDVSLKVETGFGSTLAKNLQSLNIGTDPYDLSYFVQSITLPKFDIGSDTFETIVGGLKAHKMSIIPTSSDLTMSILNTEMSLHDNFFYPWMREITSPVWIYSNCPYSKATITVTKMSNSNTSYMFIGCRPTSITPKDASNAPEGQIVRDVIFAFDYLAVAKN